jgi:hypothetical protein
MKREGHGTSKKCLILRREIVSLYYKVPSILPLIRLTSAVWKSRSYNVYNSAPPRNISGFSRPVKDDLGLEIGAIEYRTEIWPVLYRADRPFSWHTHLKHADESDVVEQSISSGHRIQLQGKRLLSIKCRYMDRIIREVTEIEPHPATWTGRMAPI